MAHVEVEVESRGLSRSVEELAKQECAGPDPAAEQDCSRWRRTKIEAAGSRRLPGKRVHSEVCRQSGQIGRRVGVGVGTGVVGSRVVGVEDESNSRLWSWSEMLQGDEIEEGEEGLKRTARKKGGQPRGWTRGWGSRHGRWTYCGRTEVQPNHSLLHGSILDPRSSSEGRRMKMRRTTAGLGRWAHEAQRSAVGGPVLPTCASMSLSHNTSVLNVRLRSKARGWRFMMTVVVGGGRT